MELLKFGIVSGADKEHFWNIIDSTYIDDVSSQGPSLHCDHGD